MNRPPIDFISVSVRGRARRHRRPATAGRPGRPVPAARRARRGAPGTTGTAGGGTAGTTGSSGHGRHDGTAPGRTTQLASQSVTERNKNPSRDGHFVQPGLTQDGCGGDGRDAGIHGHLHGLDDGVAAVLAERAGRGRAADRGDDRERCVRAEREHRGDGLDAEHRQLAAGQRGGLRGRPPDRHREHGA